MANKDLIAEIGRYIDQYYQPPKKDDIKMDSEMQTIFDRITNFREKRREERIQEFPEEYAAEREQKNQEQKEQEEIRHVTASHRTMECLLGQVEETFFQRLRRMMEERGLDEAEIKNDGECIPSKKTVLSFAAELELSLDETKDLLQSAGYTLSRSSKSDIIIAYFLQNRIYDRAEINDVLYAYGQPMFE